MLVTNEQIKTRTKPHHHYYPPSKAKLKRLATPGPPLAAFQLPYLRIDAFCKLNFTPKIPKSQITEKKGKCNFPKFNRLQIIGYQKIRASRPILFSMHDSKSLYPVHLIFPTNKQFLALRIKG